MTSREEIQEKINKLDKKAGDEVGETLHDLVTEGMNLGMTPKEALSLSDDVVETIYSHAYNLYNRGKYSEAGYIFRLLIMLDFNQGKYQMGLAASLHMEKKYEQAIQVYMLAGILNPGTPLPYYHAADCFTQIGSPASACMMLEMAENEAKGKPEYNILAERCRMMRDSLKEAAEKELAEEPTALASIQKDLNKAKEDAKMAMTVEKKQVKAVKKAK